MVLRFDTASTGTLEVQPTGSSGKHVITLEFFRADGGPPSNATFANGTWWNESERGRVFAVEVQGNAVTFIALVFDPAGPPVWYRGRGTLARFVNPYLLRFYFSASGMKDDEFIRRLREAAPEPSAHG